MWKVSVYFLQQQVRTVRGKVREVRVLLRGGGVPTHTNILYRFPPWGLSIPVPIFFLSLLLSLCLCPAPCGLVSLLDFIRYYVGGGVCNLAPLFLLSI